jgi:signal peptidase I
MEETAKTPPRMPEETAGLASAAHAAARRAEADRRAAAKKKKQSDSGRGVILLLRDIVICFAVIFAFLFFFKPTIVFQNSMLNTLQPNDYVFLYKWAYRSNPVEHGDIIVFHSELDDEQGGNKNLIKRVIGVPGDLLEIKDGVVYRNGKALVETYTKDGVTNGDMSEFLVPEEVYFVMGDNRVHSMDSRDPRVGFISHSAILGKVVFRMLPLSNAGSVK